MQNISSQCHPDLLRQSLDDVLSEQQEEQLAIHLDRCESCQQKLEALAGQQTEWSRIQSVLKHESSADHAAHSDYSSTLVPTCLNSAAIFESSDVHARLKPADFAVAFLEPSDDPEMLGRLGEVEIHAIIGRGGNGIVLKGFQKELNRLVAVKVMLPELAASAAARRRFSREAQATAAVVHPNVMPILTVNSTGQLPYLMMPYVDCDSLQQRIDREGSLPVIDILRIGLQVANGLAAAHAQGLVHRDVKPANILLERGVDRVMLTDFGLARAVDDATLTRTGLIAGTPQYMSPEQARGETVDTRSDLFSLGSALYASCTGRPPFRAETSYGILRRITDSAHRSIREVNPDIPDWLEGIINRLLAKQPDERFNSAETVAEILEQCIAHVQQPSAAPLPLAAVQSVPATRTDPAAARQLPLRLMWGIAASTAVIWLVSSLWPTPVDHAVNDSTSPAVPAVSATESTTDAIADTGGTAQPEPITSGTPPAADDRTTVPVDWDETLEDDLNLLDQELNDLLNGLENDWQ